MAKSKRTASQKPKSQSQSKSTTASRALKKRKKATRNLNEKWIQTKLKNIKLLILDIDGIMTDGKIFWSSAPIPTQSVHNPKGSPEQGWTREFSVKDGYGLKILMKAGIQVAVISGGDSYDVRRRMEWLKIEHVFLGDEDKLKALEKIQERTGLPYSEMAFMGDDLFDIPVLERVGFSATVPHAVEEVQSRVDYITEFPGGAGAVREVADAIRISQGHGPYHPRLK